MRRPRYVRSCLKSGAKADITLVRIWAHSVDVRRALAHRLLGIAMFLAMTALTQLMLGHWHESALKDPH